TGVLQDPDVDGVFVILTPQSMTDIKTIAEEIARIAREYDKPIYTSFMGEADVAEGIKILQNYHLPHYVLPESMCKPYHATLQFNKLIGKKTEPFEKFTDIDIDKARAVMKKSKEEGRTYIPEYLAAEVVEAYKLPVVPNGFATSPKEAGDIADKIGYPVVMKVMSDDIVHKFDVKGVILDVSSREEAEAGYNQIIKNVGERMPDAKIDGIFIAKQVKPGTEVILGIKRDPSFGSVVMFGLGGVFVEVFKDVSFRVAPIDKETAIDMINEIKSTGMLQGARGRAVRDIDSIAEAIMRLSQLALDCPNIKELDINPLIVHNEGEGCYVADTKIIM
ncbi:MAG: acetate--CoA ligase family protein, partial [Bacteroidota bacterium]